MVLENIINDDVCQCTRLFKNTFKIKSTPEVEKAATKSRRILGMATSKCINAQERTLREEDKENSKTISSPNIRNPNSRMNVDIGGMFCKPLEDCDGNSQDSGYGQLTDKDEKSVHSFQFMEPLGIAPKKLSTDLYLSPARSTVKTSSFQSPCRSSHFRSLSSGYESIDDGFNELVDMETLEDDTDTPFGMSNLISGDIRASEFSMECDATTPEFPRMRSRKMKTMRKTLSLQFDRTEFGTPSKVRSCLFRSPNSTSSTSKLTFDERPRVTMMDMSVSPEVRTPKSLKRLEPSTEGSPVLVKKFKASPLIVNEEEMKTPEPETKSRGSIFRCQSANDRNDHIKEALHRSQQCDDLTGDFSKLCALPLAEGKHDDLKSISPTTLANLIHGSYHQQVDGFHIIDCRYPYEFEGGHIKGAVNLYTKEMVEKFLIDPVETQKPEIKPDHKKRSILVFHCEFSFERGPNMSRFLRHIDRKRNYDCYPALHYPEIYLLDGGYKNFYHEYRHLCTPQGYRTMQDPKHEEEMKQFRNKSKSWQEKSTRTFSINRSNLKRLGF